jgi:hypothetical protein
MSRRFNIVFAILLLCAGVPCRAQDDDVSLGDLARSVRKMKPAEEQPAVIDNDNLSVMMDKAEGERLNGKPVFSIDPSGKSFRMTSPDGTCSLSFDAKATALISTPYISSDLPQYEMAKLEGEAEVRDGVLEVKLHNGSEWELKEIVVGVTLLNQPIAGLQPARLVNATELQPETKPPDVTTLYHLKATAPADAIMMFRAVVNDELSQAKDWHWALVSARGIPPAAPVSTPVPQNSLLQQSVISAPLAQETAPGAQSQVPTPTSTAVQPVVDLPIQH